MYRSLHILHEICTIHIKYIALLKHCCRPFYVTGDRCTLELVQEDQFTQEDLKAMGPKKDETQPSPPDNDSTRTLAAIMTSTYFIERFYKITLK